MKPPSGQPQQGAMFNIKPAASHQWPRGYTPDRLAEAKGFLGKMRTPPGASPRAAGVARHVVTGGVARSTAPLADYKSPSIALTKPGGKANAGYYRMPKEGQRGAGHISVVGGRADQTVYTALHEIGHATDYQDDPVRFKQNNQDRVNMGRGSASPALEGHAEGFATTHYVPDPRGLPAPRKGAPRTTPLSADQMRGYDRYFKTDPVYAFRFKEAGADPSRIGTGKINANDYFGFGHGKPAAPEKLKPEQGRLW